MSSGGYVTALGSEHLSSGLVGDQLAAKFQASRTDPYTVTQADLISGVISIQITWKIPFTLPITEQATCTASVIIIKGSNLIYQVLQITNVALTGCTVQIGFYNGRSGSPGDIIQVHCIALDD